MCGIFVWPQWRRYLVMLWGHFADIMSIFPLEGKVTENQYKIVLTDHLYLIMAFLTWWEGCLLEREYPSPIAHEGSQNGLMSMKIIVGPMCYLFCNGVPFLFQAPSDLKNQCKGSLKLFSQHGMAKQWSHSSSDAGCFLSKYVAIIRAFTPS